MLILLILVIAFIATVGFYKQASFVGIHPGKAASIPFIAAGLMIAFGKLAVMGISRFFVENGVSAETTGWLEFAISVCLLLTYAKFQWPRKFTKFAKDFWIQQAFA